METINIKNVSVDVRKSQSTTIEFFQNDTNIIKFTVTDNGATPDLETVDEILVNYARPDGEIFTRLLTAESNVITYQLGYSEMAVAGAGKISLQFYKGSDRLSTFNVNVSIRKTIEATFPRAEVQDGLVDQLIERINVLQARVLVIENAINSGGVTPIPPSGERDVTFNMVNGELLVTYSQRAEELGVTLSLVDGDIIATDNSNSVTFGNFNISDGELLMTYLN